jgi:CBS domain containing-hemolysin-like protein
MIETATIVFLVLLVALIVLSAFFSASETALFSLSRARILSYRNSKSLALRTVAKLVDDYHPTLIALIICNMVVNIAISIINTHLLGNLHLPEWSVMLLSVFISVLVLLLFGEIIPKTLALLFAEQLSARVAFPVYFFRRLLRPLIFCSDKILVISKHLFGRRQPLPLSPEEYSSYLDSTGAAGAFSTAETEMLHNIFALRTKSVMSVMTSRIEITGINASAGPDEIKQIIRKNKLEFYPVIKTDLDDTDCILSARSFFLLNESERCQWLNSNAVFAAEAIPERAKLTIVMSGLRRKNLPAALTVDEYGRVTGMISVRDIYGEMVGNLDGGYAVSDFYLERLDLNSWRLDGMMPVYTFEDLTGIQVPEDYVSHTLNGLFCEISGKIPLLGDEVSLPGLTMHAETVSHHRVIRIRVQLLSAHEDYDKGEKR